MTVPGPPSDHAAASRSRADRLADAATRWAESQVDLAARTELMHHRDLKVGMLDLTSADADARKKLLDGVPTLVTRLFPHDPLRSAALRSARAIYAKDRQMREERGVAVAALATGFASWSDPFAPRRANAPVLLRGVTLAPRGAGGQDFALTVSDELELNPVLMDAMATQLGLRLQPADLADHAGDLRYPKVVERLREAAPAHVVEGFAIAHRAVVGCFSYATVPLARDLLDGAARWAQHDVVAALAGDPDALRAIARPIPAATAPDSVDPASEHLVLDADASQSAALGAVLAGSHVVIQGPPGTGKSQTIANAVAGLVAHRQRVLVVAEKRAALDAVLDRLGHVGLANLVLDVPDAGRDRHALAGSLRAALAAASEEPRRDATTAVPELPRLRARLAAFTDHMHAPRPPWRVSAYEARCAALAAPPEARTGVRLTGLALEGLVDSRNRTLRDEVRELVELGGLALTTGSSPWYGADPATPEHAGAAAAAVRRLLDGGLTASRDATARAALELGLPAPTDLGQAGDLADLFVGVDQTQQLFEPTIWDAPLDDLVAATGDRSWRREHAAGQPGAWARRTLRKDVELVLRAPELVPDPAQRHAALVRARDQRAAWAALARDGRGPRLVPRVQQAVDAVDEVRAALAAIQAVHRDARLDDTDFAALTGRLDELAADEATLLRLPRIQQLTRALDATGLTPLLDALRALPGPVTPLTAVAAYDHCRAASIADAVPLAPVAGDGGTFDAAAQDQLAADYRDADRRHLALAARRVRRGWADRVAAVRAEHPEQAALLAAEADKQRRHLPLRDLVGRAPEVLLAVKPCWVTSPLTVPQVLPPDEVFDVVILDEASQLSAAAAVPAVARAKRVVVVGDHRQLPPSTTPTTLAPQPERSPDAAAVDELPSVLDLLATALTRRSLTWHHRSYDERLAAFSNANFYGGELVTFPGVGGEPCLSLQVVEQPPGAKDQEESGDAEVTRVVDLVLTHARNRPDESLGVVALGALHAERVEAAVRSALHRRPDLDAFFDDTVDEPFFVKDLERIQGDERDAVVLTTGYGRAADGRLLYRFGPLNQAGGERRLNVAVSRARRRLTVVSCFGAADLEPRRLAANGTRLLRDFLAYAEHGGTRLDSAQWYGVSGGPSPAVPTVPVSDALEADIAARLAGAGIASVRQHGVGSRRIPVAVRHPRRRERFVLAVETDGPGYRAEATVRDRDRLRPEHLARLGWRVHRVWAAEWFADPAAATARLRAAYEEAVADADAADAHPADADASQAVDDPGAAPVEEPAAARAPQADDGPVLPVTTSDESARGWGDDSAEERESNDERLAADRPPHWEP